MTVYADLFRYRELFANLFRRDFQAKYKGSLLGVRWSLLNVLYRDVEHLIAAALLPWFFLTPILWRFAQLPERVQKHHLLLDVLRWGNPLTPPIYAVRDALWLGHAPRAADVIYLVVAAAL